MLDEKYEDATSYAMFSILSPPKVQIFSSAFFLNALSQCSLYWHDAWKPE
jgi:hypothetical protein